MFTWLGMGVWVFTMHGAGQRRAGSVDWVSLWPGHGVWKVGTTLKPFFFSLGHGLKRHGAHKWFSECTISRFLQDACVGVEDKAGWVC